MNKLNYDEVFRTAHLFSGPNSYGLTISKIVKQGNSVWEGYEKEIEKSANKYGCTITNNNQNIISYFKSIFIKEFCEKAIYLLNNCPVSQWAELFIELKFQFFNRFQRKEQLIFSTAHGIDFFQNVLECLKGKPWLEPCEPEIKSVYGENFRKLIQMNKK